jgi:hypothetical protein
LIVVPGLIIVVAAAIVSVAGVVGNDGGAHALGHGFSVLGYHVTGNPMSCEQLHLARHTGRNGKHP